MTCKPCRGYVRVEQSGGKRVPVVLRALSIAALVVTAASAAHGQGADALELMKRCDKAEEAADLKACIGSYREKYLELKAEYTAHMGLVSGCLERKTVREVSACVTDGYLAALSPKGSPPVTPPQAPAVSAPVRPERLKREWLVKQETSRMDGSPTVFMTIIAEEPITTGYGSKTYPSMHVRCRESVTSLFIASDWFLGSYPVPVMYRIDQERPVQLSWNASSDSKAAGLWTGAVAIPFLKSLFGKETLLVRITPYNDAPREMAFPMADLAKAIEPLRKACGW